MQQNPWTPKTEFDTPERTPWWSSRVLLLFVLGFSVLVGLIIFWYLFMAHVDEVDESNIPTLVADVEMIKEKPNTRLESEGDSVYGLISKDRPEASQIKKEEEKPLHESSFEEIEESKDVSPKATQVEEIQMTLPVREEKPSDAPAKMGEFFLQVGSLPSEEAARIEVQRLKQKHTTTLGKADLRIVEKELPGKGTYYRLHVGPFPTKKNAGAVCEKLAQQGAACFVVK